MGTLDVATRVARKLSGSKRRPMGRGVAFVGSENNNTETHVLSPRPRLFGGCAITGDRRLPISPKRLRQELDTALSPPELIGDNE